LRALNKGLLGGGIVLLMLAVLSYVYEVPVYTEILGMRVPIGKEYPLRSLSYMLALFGIIAFAVGVALPSRHREMERT
jgi:riboflavin transporter FmnP